MADENTNNNVASQQTESEQPVYNLAHIYLKNLSFEFPQAPESIIKGAGGDPKVSMDIGTSSKNLEENDLRHVSLNLTIKLLSGEDESVIYLIEVEQACIVQIRGFDNDTTRRLLAVTTPTTLLPYIRETIDTTVTKAGHKPLRIAPINFDTLYQEAMRQEHEKANAQNAENKKGFQTH